MKVFPQNTSQEPADTWQGAASPWTLALPARHLICVDMYHLLGKRKREDLEILRPPGWSPVKAFNKWFLSFYSQDNCVKSASPPLEREGYGGLGGQSGLGMTDAFRSGGDSIFHDTLAAPREVGEPHPHRLRTRGNCGVSAPPSPPATALT